MTNGTCSCTMQPCGCCDGVTQLTPVPIENRPGLDALLYRVGTHAQFFETMQARLSTITVQGVGPDGQTVQTYRPLQGLTTRDRGDLSIALLDGWATVADVLTFYQERIANEGFLRTATERRSVLELARLVGYVLRPGVAATVYLAYTVDDNQVDPVTIATGARSQSVPAPGESPQSFETSEDLVARNVWNNLQVRLHRPQNITLDITLSINAAASSVDTVFAALQATGQVLSIATLVVAGTATNLKPGDKLLFTFDDSDPLSMERSVLRSVVRSVDHIDTQVTDQRTVITLQPVDRTTVACLPLLEDCIVDLRNEKNEPNADKRFLDEVISVARGLQSDLYLGLPSTPSDWVEQLSSVWERSPPAQAVSTLSDRIDDLAGPDRGPHTTDPRTFIQDLLKPTIPQVANSLNLSRSLTTSFALGTDASPQLLVQFAPILRDTFYRAWSGANVNGTVAKLKSVVALRTRTTLFGAGAARLPTYFTANENLTDRTGTHLVGSLKSPENWVDWLYADDETDDNAFLDQAYETIAPGSSILVHVPDVVFPDANPVRRVLQVSAVSVGPRSQYGLSGPSTKLTFEDGTSWRTVEGSSPPQKAEITTLRVTQIYAPSETLTLVDESITDPVSGTEIELGALYSDLKSGRWVILSGERADIANVKGVPVAELQMVSALSQGFDPDRPNDQIHTTLTLAKPTAYQYKRDTLTIYGNVVKATHGETRNEILGSGDGAQELQSFTLKQPPLTFVAAPTAAGAESTLHVFVDNVEWHEVDSLAGLGPRDHRFVTATDDAGNTQVTFGNGIQGARLPTGVQNVNAIYRSGIGVGGNVKAQQVSQLQTRPLGVSAVINPLRASGGADKEPRDLARENVPLSVIPLDRLVSLSDYADFARSFAGIAKAIARRATDGRRQLIHLTIAGADDIPIDRSSDLYRNLLIAFRKLGDRDVPVQVDPRELTALVLSAGVKLLPDFVWEPVATALRAQLLDAFGFGKRALGQPALLCEVLGVMQSVRGVSYVDVDTFGGVTEKTVDANGNRVLRDPDSIAEAVQDIIHPKARDLRVRAAQDTTSGDRVDAFPGGNDNNGVIRPAELVIFTPAVPDTLILNQLP